MITLEPGGPNEADIARSARISVRDGASADIFIRPEKGAKISISIGKGCDVRTYAIMEGAPGLDLTVEVGECSVARNAAIYTASADVKAKTRLCGKGAKAFDSHMFIQKADMKFRLETLLLHSAGGTEGDVLVKGVAAGRADARLSGMIKIKKRAGGSKSHLGEHVLMVGEDAHASANPELEIENNDVSSRHSATVSRIGAEKMFYLMSRGLPPADAERLAVSGFLESMVPRIMDGRMRGEFLRIMHGAL